MLRSARAWFVVTPFVAGILGVEASAQATRRASVDSSGLEADSFSAFPSISGDGRFIAFESFADNLVAGDTNGGWDDFVRDTRLGTTVRVSVDSAGNQADNSSLEIAISVDGNYVAFASQADNLVTGDLNASEDIFFRDLQIGVTERVSVDSAGNEGDAASFTPSLSADGRYVAFSSYADNLVAGDGNADADVFVRDRLYGTTERVSVDSSGTGGNAYAATDWSSLSSDGRYVAFASTATNLVAGDTNGAMDVFVRDRQAGTTTLVSVDSSGVQGNGTSSRATISGDGRYVGFISAATNLVAGDTNKVTDSFVHDTQTGTTERVNVDASGKQANGDSTYPPVLSADGRFVAFSSSASNLVPGDTNMQSDVFKRDRTAGAIERESVRTSGLQGNRNSFSPAISADGRCVTFESDASNLVPNDANGLTDVFVHEPFLTLEADPSYPTAGVTLTFGTWTGKLNGTALLVVIDINGAPTFVPEVVGNFDGTGLWTLSGSVPPGLGGTTVTFETLGIVSTGKAAASNPFAVAFQ